jgi:hypothetical protein
MPAASKLQTGSENPILQIMREEGLPMTRAVYIALNWWDKDYKLTPEDEAEMPPEFRNRGEP